MFFRVCEFAYKPVTKAYHFSYCKNMSDFNFMLNNEQHKQG